MRIMVFRKNYVFINTKLVPSTGAEMGLSTPKV